MISIKNIKDNVINALEDIKAFDIVSIDIRKQATIADYIVIASANSSRQAKALADNVRKFENAHGEIKDSEQPPIPMNFGPTGQA